MQQSHSTLARSSGTARQSASRKEAAVAAGARLLPFPCWQRDVGIVPTMLLLNSDSSTDMYESVVYRCCIFCCCKTHPHKIIQTVGIHIYSDHRQKKAVQNGQLQIGTLLYLEHSLHNTRLCLLPNGISASPSGTVPLMLLFCSQSTRRFRHDPMLAGRPPSNALSSRYRFSSPSVE